MSAGGYSLSSTWRIRDLKIMKYNSDRSLIQAVIALLYWYS